MSKWLGDIRAAVTLDFKFTTVNSSGVPTTLSGTPAISVYKNNSTTESTSGVTLTVDFDSRTGLNHVRIDTSADGTFYAAGSNFQVVITVGTVGSSSVIGYVVAEFSIANRSALMPTTAGRTLDVSVGGEAGIDLANVGSPTTTVNLSGVTIKDATDVNTDTDTLLARLTATRAGHLDNLSAGAVATASKLLKYFQLALRKDSDIAVINANEVAEINTGTGGYDNTTDSQEALQAEHDETQDAIAALNNLSAAQVNAEVDAALADYDPPTRTEATADKAEILTAVEAIEGGGGGDGATAAEVWSYATRTLTQGAASVMAAVNGSIITVYRGTTWVIALTGLGNLASYDNLYFSVKEGEYDTDDDAILRVDLAGLERVAGDVPGDTANGGIVVDDAVDGDITITVNEAETAGVGAAANLYYDIKGIDSDGNVDMVAYGAGKFTIIGDITRAVS